ncbi:FecR family protein [Pedobacter frigoris]|uniref:FecR family protein n=1 Tax=Pedobacter frigoris TaxID=2571272 RepID=UPI0029307D3B|nr:FecR family protein [Pedobacter frigoris]
MQKEEAKQLLLRYSAGNCSEAEKALVERYYMLYNESEPALAEDRVEELGRRIYAKLPKYNDQMTVRKLWPMRWVAAAIIAVLGIGVVFYKSQQSVTIPADQVISAYANKAVLKLASGKIINLSDAKNGVLANESGLEITKIKDGEILYKIIDEKSGIASIGYNTISTPKGGQYQISLSDGSKVWLNAASSLTYPSTFPLSKARKVTLSGEAYFEITRMGDKNHELTKVPFAVVTKGQEVEVLGTHFNISAYSNDLNVKTTLLEGIVRVVPLVDSDKNSEKDGITLRPNQQSVLVDHTLKIKEIDPDEAVAWKNGEFMFRNEPLENIMREVARWYDIEVVYENKLVGKELFGGTISRFGKVSEVLTMLELTGDVHFKIEGRKVFVTK